MAHGDRGHGVGRVFEGVEDDPLGVGEVGVDPPGGVGSFVGNEAGIGELGKACRAPPWRARVLVGGDAVDESADDLVEGEA